MGENESPIYNRTEAIARLEGDEALFAEMVNMFIAECETYCGAIEEALASGDAGALRREAHTMKSLLATFSFEGGRSLALELEQQSALGDLSGLDGLVAQVVAAARQLAKALAAA